MDFFVINSIAIAIQIRIISFFNLMISNAHRRTQLLCGGHLVSSKCKRNCCPVAHLFALRCSFCFRFGFLSVFCVLRLCVCAAFGCSCGQFCVWHWNTRKNKRIPQRKKIVCFVFGAFLRFSSSSTVENIPFVLFALGCLPLYCTTTTWIVFPDRKKERQKVELFAVGEILFELKYVSSDSK